MCDKAVASNSYMLRYVPNWFVMQQVKLWHDDEIIEWHNGYQKRKAQKAKIEEELMHIAWHPLKWWDWCMSEDEKKQKKCGSKRELFLTT